MTNLSSAIVLIISTIFLIIMQSYLKKSKSNKKIVKLFSIVFSLMIIWDTSIVLQCLLSQKLNINPIYFDYFVYIGTVFLPIAILFLGLVFAKTKITFKKSYWLLFVIPIISLIMLWTNDLHHLFFVDYSIYIADGKMGPYFVFHSLYCYLLMFIGIWYMLRYSIKNSGFFSQQSILIVLGTLFPILINILGTLKIIPMSIYLTPISFAIAIFLYTIAIFKFDFLKIAPIALQKIVDRMSDSYLVINEHNVITDFNETFLNTFHFKSSDVRNKELIDLLNIYNTNIDELVLTLDKAKNSPETFTFERHFDGLSKYFNIEINNITNGNNFLGILILFKDITQHMEDMQTIQNNQNMLVEKERLASLGQMIGGIAHNLKTPIMSIAGAAEGLSDLTKEYNSSIDDPEVTSKDHHDIAHDMDTWIDKIKTHTAYMSDIITAVKGQAVTLSENESDNFTIEELIKRINILMKHELKNALIDLNIDVKIDSSVVLNGNVNSLVQVVNNLISNAIQSYNGKTNESIDLIVDKDNSSIVILVADHGCGMPNDVKDKLFKEMITTKGKNGTGLGLFMSYSTIRGHFNGNMTFTSEINKGTTFKIALPIM